MAAVGPKLEQVLNEQGTTTYAQIAGLTDEQIDRLQERLTQFPADASAATTGSARPSGCSGLAHGGRSGREGTVHVPLIRWR